MHFTNYIKSNYLEEKRQLKSNMFVTQWLASALIINYINISYNL